jgi:class 3 adenylate cyclase
MKTQNLTIIFTDIVNYTETTAQQSRKENEDLLAMHNRILFPVFRRFRGKLIKMIGDALLIVFASPTDAMLCAMAMQDALFEHNRSAQPEKQIHIRIAASLGEVRVAKKDVFGEPVNITSRIENITPSDEIYFSDAVYMTMNKAEVPCIEVGIKALKGIAEPLRIWQIPRFSRPRLVPEDVMNNADISDFAYPYGGAHLIAAGTEREGLWRYFRTGGAVMKWTLGFFVLAIVGLSLMPLFKHTHGPLSASSPESAPLAPSNDDTVPPADTGIVPEKTAGPVTGNPVPEENAASAPAENIQSASLALNDQKKIEKSPAVRKPAPRTAGHDMVKERLKKDLSSKDSSIRRKAIKTIARSHGRNPELLAIVKEELLQGYNKHLDDRRHIDAIAWMCRVLAASGDMRYRKTLDIVASEATNGKIKRFAEKTRDRMK